jgi:hypothetical protein
VVRVHDEIETVCLDRPQAGGYSEVSFSIA